MARLVDQLHQFDAASLKTTLLLTGIDSTTTVLRLNIILVTLKVWVWYESLAFSDGARLKFGCGVAHIIFLLSKCLRAGYCCWRQGPTLMPSTSPS